MLAAVALQPGAWDATQGVMDNVLLSDLTIRNVTTPFHISLKGENRAGRIEINRINASGVSLAAGSIESWNDSPLTNVLMRDATIEFRGGGKPSAGEPLVKAPGVDARGLPVWGFYARNVLRFELDNVRLALEAEDPRPVMLAERVGRLVVRDFTYPTNAEVKQPVMLWDVTEHSGLK